jgi:tol-pal system protein YbgF
MTFRARSSLVSCTLVLLLAGCASAPLPRRDGGVSEDVQELKARVLELQRKAAVSEVELTRLRKKVAELEARLGLAPRGTSSSGAPAPPAADPRPGTIETVPPPPPTAILEEVDLEDEPPPREVVTAPTAPPRTPPAAVEAPPEPSSAPISTAAQALYDRGYTLYHQGQYRDAEATFQRFLSSFGDTDLGDNALYWIGEARLAGGDTRGALAAFRETVERYPAGNKVPDALLKAGQALEDLGDREGSRETYRELIRQFPGSAAAAVAQERLGRQR